MTWFQQSLADHKKLLMEFCCEGNTRMAEYMVTLPGIEDVVAEDGTTAFVMVLAMRDLHLVEVLLASKIWNHRNKQLAIGAVRELDRLSNGLCYPEEVDTKLRLLLVQALGPFVDQQPCDDHEQDEL